MKRWLAEATLPLPVFPLASKQAISKKPAAVLDHTVLQEILIIANQNKLDQVGMVQKIHVDPSGSVVKDVSVVFSPTTKYSDGVASGQRDIADQEVRVGTRGALQHNWDSTKFPEDTGY